ncbi:hypothetical protein SLA2020_351860 [Shorea laevis]
MGYTMGLNLLLLLAMVATNILSLYHLSSTLQTPKRPPSQPLVPDDLLRQLHTIRGTINHLTRLHPTTDPSTKPTTTTTPSDLLLQSQLSPIATACHNHPDLLHRYMNYTPFSLCPKTPTSSLSPSFCVAAIHSLAAGAFPKPHKNPPLLSPTTPSFLHCQTKTFSGINTLAKASAALCVPTRNWVSTRLSKLPGS